MKVQNSKSIKIALVGNPNVGKSVIFHCLTGVYAEVSNYPGTTIEVTKAVLENFELSDKTVEIIDTPGVYGISSFNDEETATRDYVLEADYIINVVSATTLKRDLFLTKQLSELGKPTLLVINQYDEAKLNKVEIDIKKLEENLGLKVITSVAIKTHTLKLLKEKILDQLNEIENNFLVSQPNLDLEDEIKEFREKVLSRAEALMIAEGDEVIAERNDIKLDESSKQLRERIYKRRRLEVNKIYAQIITKADFSKRAILGRLLLHPLIGSIVGLAVLYFFLYQFLGIFVAGTIVDFLENQIFAKYYEPVVRMIVELFFNINGSSLEPLIFTDINTAVGTFLAGDYGVLTLTITYLYGLLAPLVFGFYFGLAILEDCGYLPRLAVLTDGVLTRLGMNGRAIIPLILGGGCVTMAVVTTRLLTSKKEKIITMALLGLSIPCSAQLGVIQGLLSNIGGVLPWVIWASVLFLVFALAGTIMNKLIPGDSGNFVSDIPPMRIPVGKNILKKTISRSKVFLDEATPAFFIAAALVAFLQVAGVLDNLINFCEPLMSNVLLLPKEVTLSFILGMVRRDFGAFGLMDISMTAGQLITSCVVLTLFVPCIATVAVMIKESNWKAALAIWLSSWVLAFGFGAFLARILLFINFN
jgi:ferrous iron transport protein B